MVNTIPMMCEKCGKVYDVEELPNHEWRVINPDPKNVVSFDTLEGIVVRPMNFKGANQLQAFAYPSCMDEACLGRLSGDAISV